MEFGALMVPRGWTPGDLVAFDPWRTAGERSHLP